MKINIKKPLKVCDIDINHNPNFPGASRIPVNTDLKYLEFFLKEEINGTKMCGCACCNYRRTMFRALQEILAEYEKMRNKQYEMCRCCNKK